MPKMKSHSGAKKRFKVTAKGHVKHKQAHKSHLLSHEATKRKRDFRALWIIRINAAARMHGISYSKLVGGLKRANIELDRKILAELAISDPAAFGKVVETAKSA